MKSPKAPKPTADEIRLRDRQRSDMARLDDEENVRLKRLVRGRTGQRGLLSGSAVGMVGRAPAAAGSGKMAPGGKAPAPQAQK